MGVTCLCIGQIRDTGAPVGGEALQHTADAVYLIEEMSLGFKEIAEFWGASIETRSRFCVRSKVSPRRFFRIRYGSAGIRKRER